MESVMKSRCYFAIILLLLLLIFYQNANAQSPKWKWAKAIGGTMNDNGYSIAVDVSGNIYTAGSFSGTVDFDPDSLVNFNLTGVGGTDIFISKLDASGNFEWAKAIGSAGSDYAFSIALEASGHVYTAGYFQGTVDFDPDLLGNFNLTSAGSDDVFIVKLDASGNFEWAKAIGGIDNEVAYSIAIDMGGNVYTTGYFSGSVDFDPDSSGTFNLTTTGGTDIFISKLDASGNFIWAKQMGGTSYAGGESLIIDALGNIYTTGYFYGTTDFDPGAGTFNLTSSGTHDIFISKLDSSGSFIWANAMGGSGYDVGNSIALDASGNVYTTGSFEGTVDFDPGAATFYLTTASASNGYDDLFISKLDNAGNFIWAKQMGGSYDDGGSSIAIDPYGSIYITGSFQGTADFDPGTGTFNFISAGGYDIFVAKLNWLGNFEWAKAMGGISTDYGMSIVIRPSGNAYITGWYSSPVISFGSSTLTNGSGSSTHIFIAKLDNEITTGIESVENDNEIFVYPNPAINQLTIAFPGDAKKAEITITAITREIIYSTVTPETNKTEVSTKDFSEGVYLLQIRGVDFIETKKIVVVK